MRHGKSGRKLKRTASHRRATLASLCTALLRHKRITTTVAKAKEARMVAEKIITRARKAVAHEKDAPSAAIHARREVGRLIRDREVVRELFGAITDKVGTRPGGYTRVVRLGQRYGDGAEMAVLELVDFNTGQEKAEKTPATAKRKKTATGGRTTKAVEKKKGAAKTARKPKTEKPSDKSGPSTAAQPEKS